MHGRCLRCWIPGPIVLLAACGGGSSSTPVGGSIAPVELIACRARTDSPFQFAEVALRSSRNLGTRRVADRTGTERHARLHPDGDMVVFARERTPNSPASRDLFVASLDGISPELRLTQDDHADDEPCWSPAGDSILFASDRSGGGALWRIGRDGTALQPFLAPAPGTADSAPDWCHAADRIVFSRRAANGQHSLWLVNGNGTGLVPLTDGGPMLGPGLGDHAPAFAPDGSRVAFVRRIAAEASTLCVVEVATGQVTVRWQPQGEVGTPRWSPAMDRLFFGIREPLRGRAGMRLAAAPVDQGEPALLWPDQRWLLTGLDLAPGMAPLPPAEAPRDLPITGAQVQIASGSGVSGTRAQMAQADGDEYAVQTSTFDQREVAGINCRFDLPVPLAEDVLELRVRAVARSTRGGGDSRLRMSIYNPVDERFDTVVDFAAPDTTARTMEFRTASLRHVTRERQLRFTVVADLAPGTAAQLRIDLVQVELVARTRP
ncbi:MAG: PD40 domain-containing protein [Planctomycetes bacterium]|nr:PD40 domain-containing protein [Planctomycetota bacterium]